MITGKYIYKANIDGDLTIEQQIEQVKNDAIRGGYTNKKFEESLKYDVTRTVTNIFSNSVITYRGSSDDFCQSLLKNLSSIFFALFNFGKTAIEIDKNGNIESINQNGKGIEIFDEAYLITKITQKQAVEKQLEMYGVIANVSFSVLDERGMFGMFSPEKGEIIKQSQIEKMYLAFRQLFGGKKGQRKIAITEVPMKYSGVSIPVAELNLLENDRVATAKVARLYGIQEDMILSGATFDNKENAIIQTYTDYKGLIYNWITQIENERIGSFKNINDFEVTFPGVPQMNKTTVTQ